jgi:hypothetical protein
MATPSVLAVRTSTFEPPDPELPDPVDPVSVPDVDPVAGDEESALLGSSLLPQADSATSEVTATTARAQRRSLMVPPSTGIGAGKSGVVQARCGHTGAIESSHADTRVGGVS